MVEETIKWDTVGWLNKTDSGKAYKVVHNNVIIGVIPTRQLIRLLNDDIKAAPIRMPVPK